MGTYNIVSTINHPVKFAAMVSFNGGVAHRWESDSLDPETIAAELQRTADDQAAAATKAGDVAAAKSAITLDKGKIVVPVKVAVVDLTGGK